MNLPVRSDLRFGDFRIDAARGSLFRRDAEIFLRPKTWQLLCYLAVRPGRLVGKDELICALWPDGVASDDSLVQCVVELRRALNDVDRRLVQTVARRGYRFNIRTTELPTAEVATPSVPALGEAWRALRQIAGRDAIEAARLRFEREFQADSRNASALAGIALSHIIDVLNRWSTAPEWQTEVAEEAAGRALGTDPRNALAHHALAHVALLRGRHFEALAGYRKAIALDPSLGHAQLRIGVIELELGHAEATAEYVRDAMRRVPADPDFESQAAFIDGMAAFHLGQDEIASARMHRSLVLNPEGALTHQWLAALCSLHGQERLAADHLAWFRRSAPQHSIESLEATERSWNPVFRTQRKRLYEGLRRAGLPL